jgi:hypothetical protein
MKHALRCLAPLLFFLSGGTTAPGAGKPAGEAAQRLNWVYNKGSFKKAGAAWVEQNGASRHALRELARTSHYVSLYDGGRRRHFRLYDSYAYSWAADKKRWAFVAYGRWAGRLVRPLNADRFPDERGMLSTPVERRSFPHLGHVYEVLAPATPRYNCIAWCVGATNDWLWPYRPNQSSTLADFDALLGRHGYRRMVGLNFDLHPGVEKVVLYAKRKGGKVELTHGARQLSDGSWSSKLGRLPLIRHIEPGDLDGEAYGAPYVVYVRARR